MGLVQMLGVELDKAKQAEVERQLKDTGQRGGKSFGTGLSQASDAAFGGISTWIKGIASGLAAAFTVRAVVDFAKSAVAEFRSVERGWADVKEAVTSSGVDFDAIRDRIGRVADDIGHRFAFDDDEIRAGFASLVRQTGDVNGSLEHMSTVAALARRGHMDLSSAADLLGKAMNTGMTRGLQPFVGVLDKSRPIMDQVAQKLKDVEENVSPLDKGTADLSRGWGDLKEAIGAALVSGTASTDVFGALNGVLQQTIQWVQDNREEIAAWVKWGIKVAADEIQSFIRGLQAFHTGWLNVKAFFDGIGLAVKQAGVNWAIAQQQILGLFLKVENAVLTGLEAMGLGSTGMAKNIRLGISDMNAQIGELGASIATRSAEIARTNDDTAKKITTSHSTMGARVQEVHEATAVSSEHAGGRMEAAYGKAAAASQAKWEKAVQAMIYSMDSQVKAADEFGKQISDDFDKSLATQVSAQRQADDARLQSIKDTLGKRNDAEDAARAHALQAAIDADTAILQSTTATEEQKRAAFQDSSDKQAELDALNARLSLEAGDDEAKSREAAEQRKREALLASGMTAEQVDGQMADDAAASATTTKVSWLDAMNVLNGAIQGLGSVFGGVFGAIAKVAGSVTQGMGAINSAIKMVQSAGTGLIGTLTKIAGVAGGIGGAVGIVGGVIDVIGGLFHRDKDPGRMRTNQERFEAAVAGDQHALDLLYESAGRLTKDGWATLAAREDAWDLYNTALASNPTLHATGTNTVNLRGYQYGGLVPETGPGLLHRGEGVLTAGAMRDLGAGWLAAANAGQTTNHTPTWNIHVQLYGVSDRDIPDRVVTAIQTRLGGQYQAKAALAGNAALPQ